jgi:hypothetical protein
VWLEAAPTHQFSLRKARCNAYPNGAARRKRKRRIGKEAYRDVFAKLIPQAKRNIETTSNTTNMRR